MWFRNGQLLYRNPVCCLLRALYRQPDSGGLWGRQCDAHLKSIGFEEVMFWRSTYFHTLLSLPCVVNVDDFMFAGPRSPLARDMIRGTIHAELPEPFGFFVECNDEIGDVVSACPMPVRMVT